eukprot:Gb_37208 [translate_table: standard]
MGIIHRLGIFVMATLAWLLILRSSDVDALKLSIANRCSFTVWPAIQPNGGHAVLEGGGFVLGSNESRSLDIGYEWSGRIWGRTHCTFDKSGSGSCLTGDCNGHLACNGIGGNPPATLAQLTLNYNGNSQSSYSVSFVDGFNLPMMVSPHGGKGECAPAGCNSPLLTTDICPRELQVMKNINNSSRGKEIVACKSACGAFHLDLFCCTNTYQNPETCQPTLYSQLFKKVCPNAYTYPHDTSVVDYSCSAATELYLTFCP